MQLTVLIEWEIDGEPAEAEMDRFIEAFLPYHGAFGMENDKLASVFFCIDDDSIFASAKRAMQVFTGIIGDVPVTEFRVGSTEKLTPTWPGHEEQEKRS